MDLLLVDDDEAYGRGLCFSLRSAGHQVMQVTRARSAFAAVRQHRFDALILDRALPDGDGAIHLAQWRSKGVRIPVVMLTGLADVHHRIDGLDLGADDYLTKPVEVDELNARLRALVRRSSPLNDDLTNIQIGSIRIDRLKREVMRNDRRIQLQPRELRILEELALARGEVVTKRSLLKLIWNFDFDPKTKLIETHMSRLRDKLSDEGREAPIETVRGVGYRLRTGD
jgi:two-component system OmpR family response regulator